jgi:hypothetical protein
MSFPMKMEARAEKKDTSDKKERKTLILLYFILRVFTQSLTQFVRF